MSKSSDRNSSSMAPLILSKNKPQIIKYASYKANDIVALNMKGKLVVHRLIYIHPQKNYIVTKGDNNLAADGKLKLQDILGGVRAIKRASQKIEISHLYFSQSIKYLKELKRINQEFNKNEISYILLKGLPLHLFFNREPPKRLYIDADLLIKKKDLESVKRVLVNLGFKRIPLTLFGKPIEKTTQIHFKKDTKPFPVIIDLHLEPALAFTKVQSLNSLLPEIKAFKKHLFQNIRKVKIEKSTFPILKNETLLIYLMAHFYHHNFNAIHRLELINIIIKKEKIKWDNIEKLAKKFRFENLIYPGILMLQKYYKTEIPKKFLKSVKPSFLPRIMGGIISLLLSPFSRGTRTQEGIKRFIFLLLLSPSSTSQKLKIIFQREVLAFIYPSIKSLLLSSDRKLSKSFLA